MQHTRPALTAVLRASSRASVAPIRTRAIASIHTSTAFFAEEKRGFLSRLNPFAKPTSAAEQSSVAQDAKTAAELNVEIAEEEAPIPSWKSERKVLSVIELQESVRSAASSLVDTANIHLSKVQLNDPTVKFQVLKACVASTGREIPNKEIASIKTLQDVVNVFQSLDQNLEGASDNPKGHVVAEWFMKNKSSLPANMVFIPYQKSKGIKAEDRKSTNKRFL
ncbi:hypothetical protein EMPS_01544 [Entomortierella parvispora]|uniref:Large ribosomal subunit protein mL50 n=1 Tax=Entomortierella parvispora TaxID=205924 RepID=A0A9P3H332_9FUNG|nr:hypothetical protein EMPS_01544 [Entomortierella parvispora]